MSTQTVSKVATETAAVILDLFAGQTVTWDDLGAQIDQQYAMARKKTGFMSYIQVHNILDAHGMTVEGRPESYLCTFPLRQI